MTEPDDIRSPSLTISDIEREIGVAKETLRVWERRYGFPVPARDEHGQRAYAASDLAKLRLVKRLIDQGHRPGKILGLGFEELIALAETRPSLHGTMPQRARELQACIELCGTHRVEDLRFKLTETMLQMGLHGFVVEFLSDLNVMVGEAWANGRLAVFEEHLYTESVQVVMRQAIASIPLRREMEAQPRLLLTTMPQERHALGLLMVEALATLEGAACVSLGVQTPVADIARAAVQHRADIVALSFSLSMRPSQVLDGLKELRASLPEAVEIWAGGGATVLKRRALQSAKVLKLVGIASELKAWRTRHALASPAA